MLAKTEELLLKLQARKLELTKQLAEQQAKSDRLAAEASVLAARVAAEALAPLPASRPPPPPLDADALLFRQSAETVDPLQADLDALDAFMATEAAAGSLAGGSGVARKPSGDSLLPASKLARREGGSAPTSPTAAGSEGL
jgi:hypothetical protein